MTNRKIKLSLKSRSVTEGAGVKLKRAFSYHDPSLDPFLLLDDFHSSNPEDYIRGFPWHPHRGIETITYILHGNVEHGDSLGNSGIIKSGDVQWMTAGSGIIHQEMPKTKENDSLLWGFQLWANLPPSHKMMEPRYRDVLKEDIIEVNEDDGIKIKIIAGKYKGRKGPVQDIITDPEYLDVEIQPNREFKHLIKKENNVFAYVFMGEAYFDMDKKELINSEHLVLFREGEEILVNTNEKPVRFLLISGNPIREPVAWRGPIVMNTEEELRIAFEEYNNGSFIKYSE
ncbi:MAG: pirin family protein [Candidatus Lokiarchaeota archaeon]|nr:pirin family protein [Candidatus Lokiarchaeota archaeon]